MCTWLGRPVGKGDQVAGCLRAVPLLWCVQVQLLQQERSSEATTANPDQEAAIEAAIRAETDFLMQVRLQGWWWFAYGLCSGAVVACRGGATHLQAAADRRCSAVQIMSCTVCRNVDCTWATLPWMWWGRVASCFDGATVKQVVDEQAISLCAGHCIAP